MTPLLALLAHALADPAAVPEAEPAAEVEAADTAGPGADGVASTRTDAPARREARLEPLPTGPIAPLGPIEARVPWAAARVLPPAPPPEPAPWHAIPVAVEPHPVAYHYGRRFQSLVRGAMGGSRASPVFGPTVAEADVHWRLLAETDRGLDLGPDVAARWRDTAVAGSLLAGETLVHETLERAPTLYGVYVAGDTLLSPSFDLRRVGKDRVEVRHRDGGVAARRLEREEEELAFSRASRRPTPSIGTGLDWELREDGAPEDAPLVRYTAWLSATEVGISSLRFEVAPANLAWVVSGRQRLNPQLFLIGSARSVQQSAEPGRLSAGLMWMVPVPGSCNVRAERILALEDADERWMLTLRCENRTPIPAPVAPPLGDRGRGGPTLPWVPDRGPNEVREW